MVMLEKNPVPIPCSLKFLIQDVPEEGFHMSYDIVQGDLELTSDEGRILGALHLDCDVRHSSEGVCVKGTLAGTIIRACVRCLGEYHEGITLPCLGLFQGDQSEKQSSTVLLDEESYDVGLDEIEETYQCQDNLIELDVMLREQVILLTPIQRVCQSDCLGLCQHCGNNFNHSSCTCDETVRFSPMVAALQQYKKNNFGI